MKLSIRFAGAILLSTFVLTAARVGVKRIDNGGNGGGEQPASEPQSPPESSRPEPVKVRPVGPRTGGDTPRNDGGTSSGGTRGRVESRPGGISPSREVGRDQREPVRVQPARSDHQPSRSSGVSIGAGRTRIERRSELPPPARHDAVAQNTTIIRDIRRHERSTVVPNRNTWHESNGTRYCHTYRGGVHWYGFYHGPHFYWTRYHRDRWWWYDDGFNHWVYWSNGYWWWPGPAGVTYVYVNNSYYPREEAPINVDAPEPPEAPPLTESSSKGGEWKSPNGERLVQVSGPRSEAFLYDNTAGEPVYLVFLGKDVENVRFSGGKDGKPSRILLDYKNGDFALFTDSGEPVDLAPPPVPEPPKPPKP